VGRDEVKRASKICGNGDRPYYDPSLFS
jgi:hypothetical protein